MGSCISKFGPKKRKKIKKECCKDCSHIVHDKLVIPFPPQASVSATLFPPFEIEKHVSPLPSAASNASFSSFPNSTSTGFSVTSSLSSSSSSCSSSISISKDRSFSSEFLKSCVKKNPHIISQNLAQKGSLENSRNPTKINPPPSPQKPHVAAVKKEIEERRGGSTPKKRIRSNSPTIIRQKSFRKEHDRENYIYHVPSRILKSPSPSRTFIAEPSWNLRSPSPSRRFSGDQSLKDFENYNKRGVISKASLHNPQSSSLKKQSFRVSPVNQIHQLKSIKGRYNPQVSTRIDECEGEDKDKQNQDTEMMVLEDINNPRIALDCFIFL